MWQRVRVVGAHRSTSTSKPQRHVILITSLTLLTDCALAQLWFSSERSDVFLIIWIKMFVFLSFPMVRFASRCVILRYTENVCADHSDDVVIFMQLWIIPASLLTLLWINYWHDRSETSHKYLEMTVVNTHCFSTACNTLLRIRIQLKKKVLNW